MNPLHPSLLKLRKVKMRRNSSIHNRFLEPLLRNIPVLAAQLVVAPKRLVVVPAVPGGVPLDRRLLFGLFVLDGAAAAWRAGEDGGEVEVQEGFGGGGGGWEGDGVAPVFVAGLFFREGGG